MLKLGPCTLYKYPVSFLIIGNLLQTKEMIREVDLWCTMCEVYLIHCIQPVPYFTMEVYTLSLKCTTNHLKSYSCSSCKLTNLSERAPVGG